MCNFIFLTLIAFAALDVGYSFNIKREATNATITDKTLRQLLGMIRNFVDPLQTFPDYEYSSNSTKSITFARVIAPTVTDLTDYTITAAHANMSTLGFQFGITFPAVNASGNYKLNLDNELLHLVGSGPFQINVTSFSLFANVTLRLNNNKTLEMKNITTDFNFDSAKVEFSNLGEDEEITKYLNEFINQFIADSLVELKPTVMEMAREKFIPLGNFFIGSMTLDEFIDYINSLV